MVEVLFIWMTYFASGLTWCKEYLYIYCVESYNYGLFFLANGIKNKTMGPSRIEAILNYKNSSTYSRNWRSICTKWWLKWWNVATKDILENYSLWSTWMVIMTQRDRKRNKTLIVVCRLREESLIYLYCNQDCNPWREIFLNPYFYNGHRRRVLIIIFFVYYFLLTIWPFMALCIYCSLIDMWYLFPHVVLNYNRVIVFVIWGFKTHVVYIDKLEYGYSEPAINFKNRLTGNLNAMKMA